MSIPSLALIIPNFNDSRHIVKCLRSILNQIDQLDQIIIVDDCSTDNSVEIIRSAIAKHPKALFIENKKNLGVYGAINAGLDFVISDYVMFISANDFVFPGIFDHAKTSLSKNPVGIWSAMGWRVDENDYPLGALSQAVPALRDRCFSPEESIKLARKFGNWFAGPTVVYHRETYNAVGRFNTAYKGLADLVCALMVASKKGAAFSPVPYAVFRQHTGSYLNSTFANPEKLMDILSNLIENCSKIAPELFDSGFSERTLRRFILTAIKQSNGQQLTFFGNILPKNVQKWLLLTDGIIPSKFSTARMAIAFILLRPFDIWPFIWNRFLGTAIIALQKRNAVKSALNSINK